MRICRMFPVVAVALAAMPLVAAAQQQSSSALNLVVDKIVTQEQAEMQMIHQQSPLVETYIQQLRPDQTLGAVPAGDQYFLGRAVLTKGVELEPLTAADDSGLLKRKIGGLTHLFSFPMEFLPSGFLQMIYLDRASFDRQHYNFEYIRREFLGEVRCLVFDVTPLPKSGQGRFVGRIWVEDQDFHIIRFNGAYQEPAKNRFYFHFDSWRVNSNNNMWLPAFIYSEENNVRYDVSKTLTFKAQTRLWGYDLGRSRQEEELSKVLIESKTPVQDQSDTAHDLSPLQAQRAWDRQAEDNVIDRMQRMGLMAPRGEVDKVLETVVNNLEVTNNLDIQPEMRCRVLMTSTLESFTIGHTVVISRGLIDVLPDEASLAAVLAHELSHAVLGHRMDTSYAFFDRLLFDDKDTFRHFGFGRTPEEEQQANAKAVELLAKSPYKDQLHTAQLFLQELSERSPQIPNLISAHLGNRVPTVVSPSSAAPASQGASTTIAALPLGGRVKVDPWSDDLEMMKSKPIGAVAESEKMPFEVTPFILYLTRQADRTQNGAASGAVSAESQADPKEVPASR